MKKKTYLLLLAAAFALSSCQPTAKDCIEDLRDLLEDIREDGAEYDANDWEKVEARFDELVKKSESLKDITREEALEIAKIQGEYTAEVMKKGAGDLMKDMGEKLEEAGKTLEGVLDGLKD